MAADKIITQEEMDALMARGTSARSGEVEDVLPYELFGQENLVGLLAPALDTIDERLANHLRIALTDLLRRDVSVEAAAVEARAYTDFIATLKAPCNVNIIEMAPLAGPGLLVLQQELVFSLVDVFFGGKGCRYDLSGGRDFTPIEGRLIQRLRELVLRALEMAWQPFVSLQARCVSAESNPQFVTAINPDAMLALVGFKISFAETTATLHLALPCTMFEPVRAQLLADAHKRAPQGGGRVNRLLEEGVKNSQVMVRGLLAETELSLGELLAIKVGDFIPLDIPSRAVLEAEGVPLYAGHYGVNHGKRALKIDQVLLKNPTPEGVNP